MAGPTGPSDGARQPPAAPAAKRAPASAIPGPPVAATTRLPVAVTTRLPVAVTTRLPVAVTTRLPVAVTTKLPVATTKLPVATTKLPVMAPRVPPDHQLPAPDGGLRKLLAPPRGTPPAGVPTPLTARIPVAPRVPPAVPADERAAVTTRLSRSALEDALRAAAIRSDASGPPSTPRRFWDERLRGWVVTVLPGDVYVTDREEYITTVLGSCVSTCVRHPGTRAGGMNHLVLPDTQRTIRTLSCDGLASLDRLMSGVLSYGGRAEELEVKIFGGGRVIAARSDVGRINVAAVRDYFASRGLAIAIADVGGGVARRLRYEPRSGRLQIQRTVMRETGGPGAS